MTSFSLPPIGGGSSKDLAADDARLRAARVRLSALVLAALVAIGGLATTIDPRGTPADGGLTAGAVANGDYPAGTTGLVISEAVASNGSTLRDEDGDASDWIELHNPTDVPVSLAGFHLSDSDEQPSRWELPARTLQPGEYLVVFASGKDRHPEATASSVLDLSASEVPTITVADGPDQGELHTNFAFSADGEPILLVEPSGTVVADRMPPVALPRDASIGRDPNDVFRTCFFAIPSPGLPNPDECFDDADLGRPTLSQASGFFADPFELAITSPLEDATLYYTLDGTYPDPDGNPASTRVYDGPLTVSDRSEQPNTLTDTWYGWEPRFPKRQDSQVDDKATVVRARTAHGRESVATYFVGPAFAPGADGATTAAADATTAGAGATEPAGAASDGADGQEGRLPVISIVTDPDHLFDHDTGIYTPGALYEDYVASDDYDPDHTWRAPANAMERGRAWERPFEDDPRDAIRLEYCPDPASGGCDFAQDVGLRIHGGFSRALPQKNLRVYARNDYGAETLDYPFFGDAGPSEHSRLLLRGSSNDWGLTMFKDLYLQSLVAHLEHDTQAGTPTVVFINGEYWGIHNIRERFDEDYVANTHGVDVDEVALLARGFVVEVGTEEDGAHYASLIDAVEAAPFGDPDIVDRVEREVDVDGLYDSVITRLILADTDWPHGNVRMWRVRNEPTGGDHAPDDGRWRWMTFDLDHAGDGFTAGGEGHATTLRNDETFDALSVFFDADEHPEWAQDLRLLTETLLADPEHRQAFLNRYADHLNAAFDPDRAAAELDAAAARIAHEIPRHVERWGYPASVAQWEERVADLRRFVRERPAYARAHVEETFGLTSATLTVTADPAQGHVRVNTLPLVDGHPGIEVEDDGTWAGGYFAGVPVPIEAVPTDGFRFVGWEPAGPGGAGSPAGVAGVADAGAATTTVTLDGDTALVARFAPA